MSDQWVSLFSGGKDSSWALYQALENDMDVTRLLTVHPQGDSYMYHRPATDIATLAAESLSIPLLEVTPQNFETSSESLNSTARGDAELEPLEAKLASLEESLELGGVIAGAVESEYQTSRIQGLCDRLGLDLFAPLWQRDPLKLGEAMIDAGFEIQIIQVAAAGLDESWLGRTLDSTALEELCGLNESHGVHVLGEGGEFETLVTDGPHLRQPIRFEADTEWDGMRGQLRITDAWLEN